MAVFMVVMVLTIISAIGVFAARAASQVDMAAGHARHALQAQFAAEFGMRALAADIAIGQDVYLQTLTGQVGARGDCRFSTSLTCTRKESGDIMVNVVNQALPAGLLGALSHEALADNVGGTVGSFTLEMDDMSNISGGLPGFNKVRNYEVTILAVGQVMPVGAPAGVCTEAYTIASSLQRIRGQINFGPFPE